MKKKTIFIIILCWILSGLLPFTFFNLCNTKEDITIENLSCAIWASAFGPFAGLLVIFYSIDWDYVVIRKSNKIEYNYQK